MQDLVLKNVSHLTPALIALGIFILTYSLVIVEEFTHLRKSKPMVLGAGIIWLLVAWIAQQHNLSSIADNAIRHNFLDYAELLLFIIVAMTYINVLENRNIFEVLRCQLVRMKITYKQLFWITGILGFFISGIADNLTTALVMCAVILALGKENPKFVSLACINLVVAVNAGGAFSPFGDITTLMVWQKGILPFSDFFKLFLPSVINFIIPAFCMVLAVPKGYPQPLKTYVKTGFGAKRMVILFLLTIATAVIVHNYFHLPPVIGMMFGLGYLQMFGYYVKTKSLKLKNEKKEENAFNFFEHIQKIDWDTLLFFYGVILSIGGLATLGYLETISTTLYSEWGKNLAVPFQQTPANIMVGLLSAIVDNIPVMFAVLTMDPTMSKGQWLLVTLTAGVGGSLLSVGSAAGVALMGQAKGAYTFFSHLKWTWAIALGYAASIAFHLWWNQSLF